MKKCGFQFVVIGSTSPCRLPEGHPGDHFFDEDKGSDPDLYDFLTSPEFEAMMVESARRTGRLIDQMLVDDCWQTDPEWRDLMRSKAKK